MMKPQVHRFTIPGPASVNSYVVELPDGLHLVDAQRQVSVASEFADRASALQKPVRTIILTHPHPDHFGGLMHLKQRFPEARIGMSQATADELASDSRGYFAMTRQMLPDDTSPNVPAPNFVLEDGSTLDLGGTQFKVRVWHGGEAISSTTLFDATSGIVFPADLVTNGMTPFLIEGDTASWLSQIEELTELYPASATAYSGHGAPASVSELSQQTRVYLAFVRELAASDRDPADVAKEIEQAYPGYVPVAEIPDLIPMNVDAVRKEMTGD